MVALADSVVLDQRRIGSPDWSWAMCDLAFAWHRRRGAIVRRREQIVAVRHNRGTYSSMILYKYAYRGFSEEKGVNYS